MKYKVTCNINDFTDTMTIYVDADCIEEAYYNAKHYFITQRTDIDFCSVVNAEIV